MRRRRQPTHARALAVVARQACARAPTVLAVAAGLLALQAAWPTPAHAVDLFPVDDWVGDGIKKAGDVALGPLKLGVKEIAGLIAAIVGAVADLLVPKSLVKAGIGGIKWLVQLPPVGADATPQAGAPSVRMPHLQQLRDTMTWIGITLLPLGIVITAGRAFLAPTADGDSPADVLMRALTAGIALLLYDWGWGVVTELSHLLTSGLLGMPWVADGVERMLETLLIGGGAGTVVAAEFVVPLMIMIAGAVLLGLLLIRVGLEVATALLYVLGGLALGLSVTNLGRRLLAGWLIAATAIVLLPLLWSTVFCVGAAVMLDAGEPAGKGGFGTFVAQLFNVAVALAVFWIAIKLALGVFRHATGAIGTIAAVPSAGGGSAAAGRRSDAGGAGRLAALAQNATPAGLARFSGAVRGRAVGAAAGGSGAAGYPPRHPVRSAQAGGYVARHPVQATREAATGLSDALSKTAERGQRAATRAGGRVADWYRAERDGGRFSRQALAQPARPARNGERGGGDGASTAAAARERSRAGRPAPVGRAASASPRSVGPAAPVVSGSAAAAEKPTRAQRPGGGAGRDESSRRGTSGRAAEVAGALRPPASTPPTRPLWWPRARKNNDRDRKEKP